MLGFTGTFEGTPISVQSTGMGCPSAGIIFEELIMLDTRRLVRVGTCGAIADGVGMGDTIIALAASCDDTTALRYADMVGYAPAATFALVEAAATASRAAGTTTHVGPVVTSGIFYDPDPTQVARWCRLGHLAIEMESSMLYTVAAVRGIEALAIMTVSDLVAEGTSERISPAELQRGIDDMMRIACRVAIA